MYLIINLDDIFIMKIKKIDIIILLTALVLFTAFSFYLRTEHNYYITEFKENNFPWIDTTININGKVSKYYSTNGFKYIVLENEQKFIFTCFENYEYNEPNIDEYIENGCYFQKKPFNDTLTIISKDNKKYIFRMHESLNIEKQKTIFQIINDWFN